MATRIVAADGSGDFTTLEAWRLSLPAALTEPEIVQIKGVLEANITMPTTTSPENFIRFESFPGQRGVLTNSVAKPGPVLDSGIRNFIFKDLDLVSINSARPYNCGTALANSFLIMEGVRYLAPNWTSTSDGCLLLSLSSANIELRNCIVATGGRPLDVRNAAACIIDNSVIYSSADQIVALCSSTTTVRNSYAGKPSGTAVSWYTSTTIGGSNNASADTSAVTRFGAGSLNSITPASAFTDPTNNDFSLIASSPLIDAGVTISGLTADIIGTTRPQGAAYDIGAFEYGSGASSTPVALSGSVPNQTGTEGAAFSLGLSTYFSGSETPFAYSVQSGTLPAGLSLNASTGVISGTPTTAGVSSGIVIRATDATPDTADTNSFSITINAAGDASPPTLTGTVTFTSITQTSYTANWPAGLDNVAVTGYEYQIGSTAGAWTDAGNNLSAVITGRTAGATETVYVRAYDAAGLRSTPAISGSVTLLSATTDGTITVGSALYPIKYSSASVLNESGLRATVLDATTLAQVLNTSGVVCNAGVITITDAALVIGGTYHLAVKTANGWTGFSDVVTAS